MAKLSRFRDDSSCDSSWVSAARLLCTAALLSCRGELTVSSVPCPKLNPAKTASGEDEYCWNSILLDGLNTGIPGDSESLSSLSSSDKSCCQGPLLDSLNCEDPYPPNLRSKRSRGLNRGSNRPPKSPRKSSTDLTWVNENCLCAVSGGVFSAILQRRSFACSAFRCASSWPSSPFQSHTRHLVFSSKEQFSPSPSSETLAPPTSLGFSASFSPSTLESTKLTGQQTARALISLCLSLLGNMARGELLHIGQGLLPTSLTIHSWQKCLPQHSVR